MFERSIRVAALAALVVGIGAGESKAQAALIGPGGAFISGGLAGIATGDLDDRLAAQGYPTFGRSAATLGAGAYRIFSNRILLGFEGHGLIIGEEQHEGREVSLSGGYATIGVGYVVSLSPRMRIYPRLGIGGAGLALEIESEGDPVDFDDVLSETVPAPTARESVVSRDGPALDLGAGFELLGGRRGGGALVGLRLGYLVAPFDSNWDVYERARYLREATGGPDASVSGPYVRIVIGGAWRR